MVNKKEMNRLEDIINENLYDLGVTEEYGFQLSVERNRYGIGESITVLVKGDGDMCLGLLRINSRECVVEPRICFTDPRHPMGHDEMNLDDAGNFLDRYLSVMKALPDMQRRLQAILQDNKWPQE